MLQLVKLYFVKMFQEGICQSLMTSYLPDIPMAQEDIICIHTNGLLEDVALLQNKCTHMAC